MHTTHPRCTPRHGADGARNLRLSYSGHAVPGIFALWGHRLPNMDQLKATQRDPIRVWRCAPMTRRFCSVLIAAAVATALWLLAFPPGDATRMDMLPPVVMCATCALVTYRCGISSRITATEAGLIVSNPVLKKHVPWSEIGRVEPGKDGIWITRQDRWPVTAWAVQQAPISAIFRRSTRAEVVVAQIVDLAREHGSPLEEDDSVTYHASTTDSV